jgi:CheY-like chemotaxis protein
MIQARYLEFKPGLILNEVIQHKEKTMGKEKETLKILVVDDSEIDLEILQAQLEGLGFQNIIRCSDSRDANRLARQHRPDLILLDIMMPELTGGEVRELLKENPETREIPVIYISAIIKKKEQTSFEGFAGGQIIIAKPYYAEEISKAINSALGKALDS